MTEVLLENGTCLGFGGTNAREGRMSNGDLLDFVVGPTPSQPAEFACWMARKVLEASDRGESWVVAGFPGPVSEDGRIVGPMANVSGMKDKPVDLMTAMSAVDPALGRLLDSGFTLLNVNDGELAAQAVAVRKASHINNKVAALIIGTGVGTGIVNRDKAYADVFRPDRSCPAEIGHVLLGTDPIETYENVISGPALSRRYPGADTRKFTSEHPAARFVGQRAAQLVLMLGLMQGVDLVVPTGGVGAGASNVYGMHMRVALADVARYGNGAQRKFLPEVLMIDPSEADSFELYGALGVMRDHITQNSVTAS